MLKAILFDLDETLIPDEEVSLAALQAAAALAPEHLDSARLAADAGAAARRLWAQSPFVSYCERIGHSAWEGLWARYETPAHPAIAGLRDWTPGYRLAAWQEALAAQGVSDKPLAESMARRFIAERSRFFPRYPDADALLSLLSGRYQLGIVTNGVPDLQRDKIAGAGLASEFQAIAVSGECDCGKPDPGIFRQICSRLGIQPAEAVMVGDNPARDVAGAIAAGCKSVWVQRRGRARDPRYPADLEVTDLRAIGDWLATA